MAKEEEQQLQPKRLKEIYKEALNVIATNRKIFIQVTASMMLPASCLFLAHLFIIDQLTYSRDSIFAFWATNTVFCISILLSTLISYSSVVFTFAYVYTCPSSEITFRKVMAATPRICRDLVHTFVYLLIAFGIYSIFLQLICRIFISKTASEFVIDLSLCIPQDLGFFPIGVIWQLASVVTILEGIRGIEAVKRSVVLMKGNMIGAALDFFCLFGGLYAFADLVVIGWGVEEDLGKGSISRRIAIGGSFLLLFFILVPFVLVKQIYLYIACKEYHSEIIDKQMLARHLEGYLGDYLPLTDAEGGSGGGGGEVQMEDLVVLH